MSAEKKTHVAIVLDRSGSMGMVRDQVIDGFNEQVQTLRESGVGEVTVTLVTAGGHPMQGEGAVRVERKAADVGHVKVLDREDYVPQGLTPLYDGVGEALTLLEGEDGGGEDEAMLVIVISDGMENASQEWKAEMLVEKVRALEDTGRWTFTYIGANQDLGDVKKHLGIDAVRGFTATPGGYQAMSGAVRGATVCYMAARAAGATASGAFAQEEPLEGDTTV